MNAAGLVLLSLAAGAAPHLEVTVAPRAVQVGETVTVTARAAGGVLVPAEPAAADGLVLVETARTLDGVEGGFRLTFIAAEPGSHALPPVEGTFTPTGGGPPAALRADPPGLV
jgi:hypothetical protein